MAAWRQASLIAAWRQASLLIMTTHSACLRRCVAAQEGQTLLRRVPEVDLVMGPHHANRWAAAEGQGAAASVTVGGQRGGTLLGLGVASVVQTQRGKQPALRHPPCLTFVSAACASVPQDWRPSGAGGAGQPGGGHRPRGHPGGHHRGAHPSLLVCGWPDSHLFHGFLGKLWQSNCCQQSKRQQRCGRSGPRNPCSPAFPLLMCCTRCCWAQARRDSDITAWVNVIHGCNEKVGGWRALLVRPGRCNPKRRPIAQHTRQPGHVDCANTLPSPRCCAVHLLHRALHARRGAEPHARGHPA